jgi:phosphoesterase RecJ-like protein
MADTEDFGQALAAIAGARRFLVTSHTRPDGDAAGCMSAMCNMLGKTGKQAYPLLLSPLPDWYEFIFEGKVPVLGVDVTPEGLDAEPYRSCDLVIIVDANSRNQLPGIADWLGKTDRRALIIDHHLPNDPVAGIRLADEKASASGLLVYEMAKQAGWPISRAVAKSLFVAISTDTGWFRFQNCDERTLRTAGELVRAGAEPAELYRRLYQNWTEKRMRLLARLLQGMRLENGGKLAIVCLRNADFVEAGAARSDTENLIDELQRIGSVEAVAMVIEQEDGSCRCSLRSRGRLDVQKVAAGFGGGGHRQAAGATIRANLGETIERLRTAIMAAGL